MHQPLATPRPSLYYPYEVFDPWLPSGSDPQPPAQVVIVGMGPVGLTTALELSRHGVRCIVIGSERQVSEGSRAIVFTRRTMEILQQVGVADKVVAECLPWRFGNSFYRGQQVYRMQAPHGEHERFFPMNNLQQQYVEQYLLEACRAQPLIELRWGNRLLAISQTPEMVTLEIDTATGPYILASQWVVAADGARSAVRQGLGLQLRGASYEGRFVIADIQCDLPFPTERQAYFDPPWNPGNTVLLHREPHGIWRIDYQLPADETPQQALEAKSVTTRINAVLAQVGHADTPWQLDWCSVYSARTLTLEQYVHGRVLFAGDAAHLLPIFGVRGANTGFQDAQALGWQLGMVVNGTCSRRLLENYSRERVGAAWEIIHEAGKSTRFMTPPSRGFRLLRNAVLSLSLSETFVRPLYHWRTSRPHEYHDSWLNCATDDNASYKHGPGLGAPPLNVRLGPDNYLLDHLGGGFDLLLRCDSGSVPLEILNTVNCYRDQGVRLRLLTVNKARTCSHADLHLNDPEGLLMAAYDLNRDLAAYLFRPDQHVCARWLALSGQRLGEAMEQGLLRNQRETTA